MNIRRRLLGLLPLALLTLAPACTAPVSGADGETVASSEAPLSSWLSLPQGMTCGLTRPQIDLDTTDGATAECDGNWGVASGYSYVFTGDFGMPAGEGFYNDSLVSTTASARSLSSDRYPIPRGVVCGLMHTKNAPTQTCLGYNAWDSCPNGWERRTALDQSSSQYWAWCEYEDPNALCPPGKCIANVPSGTVCGLSDNASSGKGTIGICENVLNGPGIPISRTYGCPSGWDQEGPRDEGAPSGVGLQWCRKK